MFAALNAFLIPVVYLFFPETAGRSLEDMDVVFALAYREGVSPVKVSLRSDVPRAGSKAADEILGVGPGNRNRNNEMKGRQPAESVKGSEEGERVDKKERYSS